jgi:tetratricopeptide (TPR) repeat protein
MQVPLGELGGEVVKIAPTIADLIGKQPELEAMDDAEKERVRFLVTVTNFLLNLCSKQNPFILFLDDLQWADEGSIDLLGRVAESVTTQPMVVIASYRDTDVDKHHPWVRAMDAMKEKNIPLTNILVKPFDIEGTTRIASEILMEEEDAVLPLTMELHGRTEGNAFFVIEMLRALVDQEIIFFKDNQYQYDLGKFRGATLPTNVVDVVLRRVDYISEENQKIIAYASLMGREIEFERISDLTEISREIVIDAIEDGIKNQLLTRDITGRENVVFMHDRIREALYRKISEEERVVLHGQIAHLLEEQHKDNLEPFVFELAHHFTQAGIEEKTLQYSLEAGKKAQASYANNQAIRLYEVAKGIYEKQGKTGTTEYIDTFENLGAVYYQAGRFDEALETLRACESLIPKENKLGKAQVFSKIGDTLQKKGELQHCEQVLVDALKLLGIRLPNNIITVLFGNLKQFFIHGLQSVFPNLFVKKEYSEDPEAEVIAYLLHRLFYYYYFTDLIKSIYVQFRAQNMAERMLGPDRMLSKIYAITGMAWMQVGWPWWARRHIRLAEKIAEDLNDKAYIGLASAFHGWVEHPYRSSESVKFAKKAVDLLKSVGEYWDLGHAGCCMYWGKQKAGENLNELIQGNRGQIAIMESINALQNLGWALGVEGMFVTFIGDERLKNEGISTLEESTRLLEQVNDKAWLLCAHGYLAYAHLRLGNYDKAIPYAERVSRRFWSDHILTTWLLDILGMCAYVYLYTLMNKPDLTEDERKKYLKGARRFCRLARFKGVLYPNYRGWAYLVNGTYQWITGKKQQAIKTWDQGIAYLRAHSKDIYRLASILLEEASFLIKDNPRDEKAKKYLIEAKRQSLLKKRL